MDPICLVKPVLVDYTKYQQQARRLLLFIYKSPKLISQQGDTTINSEAVEAGGCCV